MWCRVKLSRLLLACSLAIACTACTDARLYGEGRGAAQADRLTLSGRVCAEDPRLAGLPLKIVFLLDQSAPILAFDPASARIMPMQSVASDSIVTRGAEAAVLGFAARPRKIAPMPGDGTIFTTDSFQVEAGIAGTMSAIGCQGRRCRDPGEALRSARALIEDDMAATPAGERVVTEYAVVLLTGGIQDPLPDNIDCCASDDAECRGQPVDYSLECAEERLVAEGAALREAVLRGGALGVKVHVLHLTTGLLANRMGMYASDAFIDQNAGGVLRALVRTTTGTYTSFDTPSAITTAAIDVLGDRASLDVKTLTVANMNARPGPDGPRADSDADGFTDVEEEAAGTSPIEADTDGDAVTDFVETLIEFDPLVADDPSACRRLRRASRDSDLDGLTDCDEALLGTEPTLVDSDGDGLPDSLEVFGFTEYLRDDAALDSDDDGAPNGDELRTHTDARSTDTRTHLTDAYRYEIVDQGSVTEGHAALLDDLFTVEVVRVSPGTTPGLAEISWNALDRTLAFRDALDQELGPPVVVPMQAGEIDLPSSSYAPAQGDDGRILRVRIVDPLELPEEGISELLRIGIQTRRCIEYTVRNVRLVDTLATDDLFGPGLNRVVLFFGETPAKRLDAPGPFRLVEIPVVFRPPNRRVPGAAVIGVADEEFVLPDAIDVDFDE